jgi:hypothetical protein
VLIPQRPVRVDPVCDCVGLSALVNASYKVALLHIIRMTTYRYEYVAAQAEAKDLGTLTYK